MPKIHSLLVLGLHRYRLLSPEFTCTYRVKVPEPTNERESCVELVHAIVLGLTWVHPNTTKQRDAHYCYPLRAPVKAVDRQAGLFSSGARVSPQRGSRASGWNEKLGGVIPCVYKCD